RAVAPSRTGAVAVAGMGVPPWQQLVSDAEIVECYLVASMVPDPVTAARYLAVGLWREYGPPGGGNGSPYRGGRGAQGSGLPPAVPSAWAETRQRAVGID